MITLPTFLQDKNNNKFLAVQNQEEIIFDSWVFFEAKMDHSNQTSMKNIGLSYFKMNVLTLKHISMIFWYWNLIPILYK